MFGTTLRLVKSFKPLALVSALIAAVAGVAAVVASIAPAYAASLTSSVETEVAVFVIPVTLLVAVMLFEVARVVWRGAVPAEGELLPRRIRHWSAARSDD